MSQLKNIVVAVLCICFLNKAYAVDVDLKVKWPAFWISCPGENATSYGVYHFRKSFTLASRKTNFFINVSADNRYRLFVNGQPVSEGPARGDLMHWYYETVDIAPYLKEGTNLVAAIVWNVGEYRPLAQLTNRTGLIIQSGAIEDSIVNTNESWKAMRNAAYKPITLYNYFVGASDSVDAAQYPWGWEQVKYKDDNWSRAAQLERGTPYGSSTGYGWILTPADIPQMEQTPQRMHRVRKAEGITVPANWPDKDQLRRSIV